MKRRTAIAFGFSALAGLLAFSSAAYACTYIQGKMTASGNGGTTTAVSVGSGGPDYGFNAMTWCSATGTATAGRPGLVHIEMSPYGGDPTSAEPKCVPAHQLPDTGSLKSSGSAQTLTPLGQGPFANPTCATPVIGCIGGPSVYTVTYTTLSGDPALGSDCMNRATNTAQSPTTHQANPAFRVDVTVDGSGVHYTETDSPEFRITNGSGSGDYRISPTAPFSGGLCVSDELGGRGNQVSLTVV